MAVEQIAEDDKLLDQFIERAMETSDNFSCDLKSFLAGFEYCLGFAGEMVTCKLNQQQRSDLTDRLTKKVYQLRIDLGTH